MKLSILLVALSLLGCALAIQIPYTPVNDAYHAQTGQDLPHDINGLYDDSNAVPTQETRTMGMSAKNQLIKDAKRICGSHVAIHEYDIQRDWKANWAETMPSTGTQSGQLRFINATTGLAGNVFLTLEGVYNSSLICNQKDGCVGFLSRTLAPPGTPSEFIPVENSVVVFKRVALGAPRELCVLNTDIVDGIDPERIITRLVSHPDAMANMDASKSGVGNYADAGMGMNYYQRYGSDLRIRAILYLMSPALISVTDAVVIQVELLIDSTI